MLTSTEEYKEAYKKSKAKERRFSRILWGILISLLLGAVIAVGVAFFWPRTLPVYRLGGQCSTDYYVQHPIMVGKVIVYDYEQVRVCP